MSKKQVFVFGISCLLSALSFSQSRYDVLIHEIMADPTPVVGLPAVEWIELVNRSGVPISLAGWKLRDRTSTSGAFPDFTLEPGQLVLLGSSTTATVMAGYGPIIPVPSFPSLDNESDLISLLDPSGQTIHAVAYSVNTYKSEIKRSGGWSLEMIDRQFPCTGPANWQASTHPTGGTPGQPNAAAGVMVDTEGPRITNTHMEGDQILHIQFNEPLDSTRSVARENIQLPAGFSLINIRLSPPLFDQLEIEIYPAPEPGKMEELTLNHIRDCRQIPIAPMTIVRWGRPVIPSLHDLVINEILFNPRSGGSDYIEIYNRSTQVFDARELYLANRKENGEAGTPYPLRTESRLIFPGEYWVVTTDSQALIRDHWVKNADRITELSQLPSFPADKGHVLLLHQQGTILDEVNYDEDWHSPLVNDPRGISLERIDPNGPSQDPMNWHSAATTSRGGTPGYRNSQSIESGTGGEEFWIEPVIISPNNDGFHDHSTISYQLAEPGQLAHIRIFDQDGRMVRFLVNTEITGRTGTWTWDGLGDGRKILPSGNYIVWAEFLTLQGKRKRFRRLISVVRGYP
ncbi:MAG: lamin tail domain-containing protein [Chitinophagales bacterium]|nr:lamin tail domain-containing protein [Chitinophagales bacterium]